MKYITRKLYNSQQGDLSPKKQKAVRRNWEYACGGYRKNLETIKLSLPKTMQQFCKITLHDGIVKSFFRTKNSLTIKIDGCGCWGPAGKLKLTFFGVKSVKGLDRIAGDCWLYEEVHLSKKGKFEYHVLLHKSELVITADEVEFIEKGKRK